MWDGNLWWPWSISSEGQKLLETTALDAYTAEKQAAVDEFRTTLSDPFTLEEVDSWYEEIILPLRTVQAGMPPVYNPRYWDYKAMAYMRKFQKSNEPDPNKLCGDAALYVLQEYRRYFPPDANNKRITSEGLTAERIVCKQCDSLDTFDEAWKHTHASVLMIDNSMIGYNAFMIMHDPSTNGYVDHEDNPEGVTWDKIKDWHVYDLWEKLSVVTLDWWWTMCQGFWPGEKTIISLG
jgi:hypothetical protein